jgi:hypothetical protein
MHKVAIVTITADNQEPMIRTLQRMGAVRPLGRSDDVTAQQLETAIAEALADVSSKPHEASRSPFDLLGASRIAARMLETECAPTGRVAN